MKFFITAVKGILTIVLTILILVLTVWAGVQVKSWYTKSYKFNISSGQRIIVVDENTTQVRVYPKESRIFDSGRIKEGKRLSGVLTEK